MGIKVPAEQEILPRILVLDDAPDILIVVEQVLIAEGFEVATGRSGSEGLQWVSENGVPHLAVVDIMMPEMNGLEFCREVQKFCDLPVILLTAIDEEETVVKAIDEVAEDYVTKPFKPRELAARVKRLIRRIGDFSYALGPVTEIDRHLSIDFANQKATVDQKPVVLTPTETKLLHILMRSAHRTVTTSHLLRRLWPLEEVFEDTLRVHVHRLRHKIEPNPTAPRYLVTQRGAGYCFLPKTT